MDILRNKRILWLLNHTTLRDAEVPMLIRLGFEVYLPKIVPFDEANRSTSVTYIYDSSLSINQELLKKLNSFDFYTESWSKTLAKEINEYFGTAIVPVFPKMVDAVCDEFEGPIFLRIFGLEGNKTYADRFKTMFSKRVFNRIRRSNEIYMAASIANTIDNEPHWIRKNTVYLPQGLPLDFYSHENQWRGDKNRIFFVCPRIKSHPYYNQIYQDFKKTFGDLPHIIAGAQPVEVTDDPSVTGFVEQKEYVEIFKSSKVMYYHSMEERHLHYHPIEAIVYGLPVIFMSGGVLEFLAKKKLPGCCETLEEARVKIQRILNGDVSFTQEVTISQKALLREFDTLYVEKCWRERFVPFIESHSQKTNAVLVERPTSKLTHVGIWMHETNPNGFTGEGISRLLAMIVSGSKNYPDLQIHIAAVSWVKQAIIDYMDDLGVDTQHLSFELVSDKPPLIFQVYNWWINRKPRPRKQWFFGNKLRKHLQEIRTEAATRFIALRPGAGLLIMFSLVVIVFPFIVVLGILFAIFNVIRKLLDRGISLLHINELTESARGHLHRRKETIFGLAPKVYAYMADAELKLLARKVGRDKKFTAWFFAYPNQKYLSYFNSATIVAVPDIVYFDFPSRYSRAVNDLVDNHFFFIKQTISNADAVITFSEHVRQNQIIRPAYQPKENVTVIRHAPIETRSLISSRPGVDDSELLLLARRVIKNYLQKQTLNRNDADAVYLRSLNLGDISYLFVSSQSRLHKNHLKLLEVYRILLREKYINIKLVFTGEFSDEMQKYITQERLHLDVLSMHYMPPVVHASFYACARLTVIPTLFEGGFPFVFSESLSVNTPVVMSNIPVVREILSEAEQNLFCFDPYNTQGMVEKIKWALENRSSLLSAQTHVIEQMKMRTWAHAAEEYLGVIIKTKKRKRKA